MLLLLIYPSSIALTSKAMAQLTAINGTRVLQSTETVSIAALCFFVAHKSLARQTARMHIKNLILLFVPLVELGRSSLL